MAAALASGAANMAKGVASAVTGAVVSFMPIWHSDLFGCFEECNMCCCAFFCYPCAYGKVVHATKNRGDEGGMCGDCGACCIAAITLYIGFYPCCCAAENRKEIRTKDIFTKLPRPISIPELPCADFFVHCFCSPCAIVQEWREIYIRMQKKPNPKAHMQGNLGAPEPEIQEMER